MDCAHRGHGRLGLAHLPLVLLGGLEDVGGDEGVGGLGGLALALLRRGQVGGEHPQAGLPLVLVHFRPSSGIVTPSSASSKYSS